MSHLKLPQHGRNGAIVGSDPIPPGPWITPSLTNGAGFIRYRRTNENDVQFEADLSGLNPGDVVTTIVAPYIPLRDAYGVGKYGAGDTPGVCVWKLATTGDLVFVGQAGGAGSDTTAIHWGANTDPTGSGVTLDALGSLILNLLASNALRVYDSTGVLLRFLVNEAGSTYVGLGTSENFKVDDSSFNTLFRIDDNGAITMRLNSGQQLNLNDSSDNPMLQMTEGSPDLHLPTGGNVIFDL